jgi:hypothetical protein
MSQNVQILTGIDNVNFMFYFDKSGKRTALRKKKKTKKIKLHSLKDFFFFFLFPFKFYRDKLTDFLPQI